jgi:hypothetical protein
MSANTKSLLRFGVAFLALIFLTFVFLFVRADTVKGWGNWMEVCTYLVFGIAFTNYAIRGK